MHIHKQIYTYISLVTIVTIWSGSKAVYEDSPFGSTSCSISFLWNWHLFGSFLNASSPSHFLSSPISGSLRVQFEHTWLLGAWPIHPYFRFLISALMLGCRVLHGSFFMVRGQKICIIHRKPLLIYTCNLFFISSVTRHDSQPYTSTVSRMHWRPSVLFYFSGFLTTKFFFSSRKLHGHIKRSATKLTKPK
jgi:hypothetical protein